MSWFLTKELVALRLALILWGFCLGVLTLGWIGRFIHVSYHTPLIFYPVGICNVFMILIFIYQVKNYLKLSAKE